MRTSVTSFVRICILTLLSVWFAACTSPDNSILDISHNARIVLTGNNLGSRMMEFGHFETEMHLRYPDHRLFIRNLSVSGDTPGFRPHAARNSPWAFPGAEEFRPEYDAGAESRWGPLSEGHFPSPDEWLEKLKPDVIIALFGYNESFRGEEGLELFKAELDAFIRHTLNQNYNEGSSTQLVMVSPIAFEDLSDSFDLPDGKEINANLNLYTQAIKEVSDKYNVLFADVFSPTRNWFESGETQLTIDGSQFNDTGYKKFSGLLVDLVFGPSLPKSEEHRTLVHNAVMEKNWMWHNDFKMPNGVHAYGRRFEPFGPDNYPAEIEKIRQMTAVRDKAIWKAVHGEVMDIRSADQQTIDLPPVQSNYDPAVHGNPEYLYGQDALNTFTVAPGYSIELFASEEDFAELANPVQLAFDNRGRLWVAVMPSYPHYKPGDTRPNDKLLILEDTNGDGKADRQTVFADGLHLPVGFELAPEGVYVSQGPHLMLLTDTTGDDRADTKEIVLSGFDDHDTHHAHSTYTLDPSGAIYMAEGVFLHSNVETSYGPVRATNGGFFRYNPQRRILERTAQLEIPNPWGIAFDEWGQDFFTETSGPDVRWLMPGTIRTGFGETGPKSPNLIEDAHRVRPTSGLEFVSSRHFPDEVQGDLLVNNTIGFLGMKQHTMEDDGTGYRSRHRQDLVLSTDPNFRPVDMEFAPDGSLYLVDWHNVLIGHMQHNARDPFRDHAHGRVYRITYPARPLVEPAPIADAGISELLDNLKLPEYRTRYRTRRELRGHNTTEVISKLKSWVENLDEDSERFEHHLLEALWVSWGLNAVEESLLRRLLVAKDFRVRAAAVRVLRYSGHQLEDQADLLVQAAGDPHGRVRLEAIVAASWMEFENGIAILSKAANHSLDDWMSPSYNAALAQLSGETVKKPIAEVFETSLTGNELDLFLKGREIYGRNGYCGTCHGSDGRGIPAAGFPPLHETRWVTGSKDRLIKLTLHGLAGPITVLGEAYPGNVPMTPFKNLLNDEEMAAVLTYIRNSFGNNASAITSEQVKEVREITSHQTGFYSSEELLKEHPMEEKR